MADGYLVSLLRDEREASRKQQSSVDRFASFGAEDGPCSSDSHNGSDDEFCDAPQALNDSLSSSIADKGGESQQNHLGAINGAGASPSPAALSPLFGSAGKEKNRSSFQYEESFPTVDKGATNDPLLVGNGINAPAFSASFGSSSRRSTSSYFSSNHWGRPVSSARETAASSSASSSSVPSSVGTSGLFYGLSDDATDFLHHQKPPLSLNSINVKGVAIHYGKNQQHPSFSSRGSLSALCSRDSAWLLGASHDHEEELFRQQQHTVLGPDPPGQQQPSWPLPGGITSGQQVGGGSLASLTSDVLGLGEGASTRGGVGSGPTEGQSATPISSEQHHGFAVGGGPVVTAVGNFLNGKSKTLIPGKYAPRYLAAAAVAVPARLYRRLRLTQPTRTSIAEEGEEESSPNGANSSEPTAVSTRYRTRISNSSESSSSPERNASEAEPATIARASIPHHGVDDSSASVSPSIDIDGLPDRGQRPLESRKPPQPPSYPPLTLAPHQTKQRGSTNSSSSRFPAAFTAILCRQGAVAVRESNATTYLNRGAFSRGEGGDASNAGPPLGGESRKEAAPPYIPCGDIAMEQGTTLWLQLRHLIASSALTSKAACNKPAAADFSRRLESQLVTPFEAQQHPSSEREQAVRANAPLLSCSVEAPCLLRVMSAELEFLRAASPPSASDGQSLHLAAEGLPSSRDACSRVSGRVRMGTGDAQIDRESSLRGLHQYINVARSVRRLCRFFGKLITEHLDEDFQRALLHTGSSDDGQVHLPQSYPPFRRRTLATERVPCYAACWIETVLLVKSIFHLQLKGKRRRAKISDPSATTNTKDALLLPHKNRSEASTKPSSKHSSLSRQSSITSVSRQQRPNKPSSSPQSNPSDEEHPCASSCYWIVLVALLLEQRIHAMAQQRRDLSLLRQFCCCRLFYPDDMRMSTPRPPTSSSSERPPRRGFISSLLWPEQGTRPHNHSHRHRTSPDSPLRSPSQEETLFRRSLDQLQRVDPSDECANVDANWGAQIDTLRRFLLLCYCAWSWIEDEDITSGNVVSILQHVWWCTDTQVKLGLAQVAATRLNDHCNTGALHETATVPTVSRTDFYAEYLALPTSCSTGDFEAQVFMLLSNLHYNLAAPSDIIVLLSQRWQQELQKEGCCSSLDHFTFDMSAPYLEYT